MKNINNEISELTQLTSDVYRKLMESMPKLGELERKSLHKEAVQIAVAIYLGSKLNDLESRVDDVHSKMGELEERLSRIGARLS